MFRFRQQVNLDNNATTPVAPDVVKAIARALRRCHGNPSSNYRDARDAAVLLQESRQAVAAAVGATAEEILFTSCASEANNQVLMSCLRDAESSRNAVVSTPIEHPSVLATLAHLQSTGMEVHFCSVDKQGRVDLEQLESLLNERTALVCCMRANNETGVIQDVPKIAEMAHRHGAWVMADCVQALGKIPVDVQALGVDYAVFSAHKLHGPKGVGALYARAGAPLFPLIHGGHQENGLRAGTEGVHNIAGFAQACRSIPRLLAAVPRIVNLRNQLASGIARVFPAAKINSMLDEYGLPNTLSVTFPGFDGAEAIGFLDYHGIGVSAGSACNTQGNAPSHVLKAIGLSDEEARQSLRFSLSDQTSERDISYTLSVVRDYLERRALPVAMVRPAQVDENLLFSETVFILDVRYGYDRKLLKALPNSHETSYAALKQDCGALPKDKHILVVCQAGTDGPVVAYYLRSKGFKNVSFIMGGVVGWKLFQSTLYDKYGDWNKKPLQMNAGAV